MLDKVHCRLALGLRIAVELAVGLKIAAELAVGLTQFPLCQASTYGAFFCLRLPD